MASGDLLRMGEDGALMQLPALLAELTAISVQLAGHSLAGMQEQP